MPINRRRPTFFIVGAPKCGTTAMDSYLSQHPDIFMSTTKELHYFGSDLEYFTKTPLSEARYLSAFRDAKNEKIVGESSVFYLYSRRAAAEIQCDYPDAKILIMLRNPVDALHSYHSQLVYQSDEDLEEIGAALAAEERRKCGQGIPALAVGKFKIFYSEIYSYAAQVQRYLDIFPAGNVRIALYEDFAKDTGKAYRDMLDFLGVDTGFCPEFRVVNPNKKARSRWLSKTLRKPPGWVYAVAELLPGTVAQEIKSRLRQANTAYAQRAPIKPSMRRQLATAFSKDVEALEQLLERPLKGIWKDFQDL